MTHYKVYWLDIDGVPDTGKYTFSLFLQQIDSLVQDCSIHRALEH